MQQQQLLVKSKKTLEQLENLMKFYLINKKNTFFCMLKEIYIFCHSVLFLVHVVCEVNTV